MTVGWKRKRGVEVGVGNDTQSVLIFPCKRRVFFFDNA